MLSINRDELFMGLPYEMRNGCNIYQLYIKDIYGALAKKYQYYIGLLTMETEDLKETIAKKGFQDLMQKQEISVFDYLMRSAEYDNNFFLDLKDAFSTFLQKEILISTKNNIVIVGNPQDKCIIDNNNFEEFQYGIRLTSHMRVKELPPENETPQQKRFRLKKEMRERVKEKQAQKNAEDGDVAEFADILSSLCVAEIGITPINIGELTVFQVKELLERAQAKEKYHTELDILAAGGDPKKIKPKYWIRNLTKEVN